MVKAGFWETAGAIAAADSRRLWLGKSTSAHAAESSTNDPKLAISSRFAKVRDRVARGGKSIKGVCLIQQQQSGLAQALRHVSGERSFGDFGGGGNTPPAVRYCQQYIEIISGDLGIE